MNLDAQDKTALEYAAKISRMANSERVHFIHVVKMEIPRTVLEDYPTLFEIMNESAREKMKVSVEKYFKKNSEADTVCYAVEGIESIEIIRKVREKSIDLVIVGEDENDEIKRRLPEKLIRKSPCSVLALPQNAKPEITKVLAPLDFSKHSADTVDVALAFTGAAKLKTIDCIHTYSVPTGFHTIGKTYEEFAEIMKKNAETDYEKFIKSADLKGLGLNVSFILENHPHKAINKYIHENQVDLLIVGARGKSTTAAALLGNTAEHLIHTAEIPILVVKRKNENLSFVDALLEI